MRTPGVRAVALLALTLSACTADETPAPAASLAPHVDCDHPPAPESTGIQGEASSGSVVAWVMADKSHGLPVGETLKIVWRMTGAGDARFSATGPGSATVAPAWGPEPHGGSTFQYPGDEWGTGFAFPAPGCWTIHVTRDDMTGTLSLPIT
ncbi:hypothetical protein [Amycolatopsis sp.]|uniref:hypothetical protein n=1 Tax=Amycolatopsis sp. TaxID=37632 RepID=UPI002E05BBF1|nr:hypothetical protein [Amycolatopsis sp.]